MVGRSKSIPVEAGGMVVVELFGCRLDMIFAGKRAFLCGRLTGDPTRTVKAGAVVDHRGVVDNSTVDVGVVDNRGVDVDHRGIIPVYAAGPAAADKTDATIAAAIITPAIEADVCAPVAAMPAIYTADKAPVTGRPQKAGLGRSNPDTGNPIIPIDVIIGPVTGRPQVPLNGTRRLYIDREGWRRRPDRNADGETELSGRGRRHKARRENERRV
jgi:hypothetical protein